MLSAKLSQWNDSALGSSRYPLEGSLKVRKSLQAGSKSYQEQQDLNPGFNHPLKPLMELFNGARLLSLVHESLVVQKELWVLGGELGLLL